MKKKSTLEAGLGYIVGNYLLKGITFFSVPIFARLMSQSDFGVYNTFTAYEGILFVVIGFAIHSSYKNAYFNKTDNRCDIKDYSAYVSMTVSLILINAIFLIGVSLLFDGIISNGLKMDSWMIVLLIVYAMSSAILSCYNADCSLRLEYKRFLAVSGFNAVCNIIVSVILITCISNHNSYTGRIIGTVSAVTLVAGYVVIVFFKRARPRFNRREIIWGLKYGLPIVPHGISQVVLSSFDRIMINNIIGSAQAGIYSFAYTIYTIIQVTSTSIDTVWSPWFYKARGNGDYAGIKKQSNQIIILMLLLCISFLLISPEFIVIFGGKKYEESVFCVMPLVGGAFFAFLYFFPAVIEYYHGKTGYIAIGTATAALINIVLNYIFINEFGYIAAAYTTLATYLLYFIFHLLIAIRIEKKSLYSLKTIALSTLIMVCSVVIGSLLVERIFVRIVGFAVMIAYTIYYEETHFHLVSKMIDRILKLLNRK